jgi:hypothetical protein
VRWSSSADGANITSTMFHVKIDRRASFGLHPAVAGNA